MDDAARANSRDAFAAARRSASLLIKIPPRAEEAWQTIFPYLERTSAPDSYNRPTTWMLLALAGDCRRELGYPREAAEWYRKASKYGDAHADYYAKVVLEHRFVDHYADAAAAARKLHKNWYNGSFFYRAFGYVLWWFLYGLWRPEMRRELRDLRESGDRLLRMVDRAGSHLAD